jgi:kynurenine formamidase
MNKIADRYIDLSHPIIDSMPVYPGDEPSRLERINTFVKDGFDNFRFTSSLHIGSHIDGPMHMTDSAWSIDKLPLERFIGAGCFINAVGRSVVSCTTEFKSAVIPESIVLVHTGFSAFFGTKKYFLEHPVLTMEAAAFLVEQRIKMICLDTPSPDKFPYDVHKFLLTNSILIAENLIHLEQLAKIKEFEIIAVPLPLQADSSPARIMARIQN